MLACVQNPYGPPFQLIDRPYVMRGSVALPLDGLVQDTTIFTVPAAPAGAGRFVLERCFWRLSTAMTGAGQCTIRVGSTVGGNEVALDVVVNAGTAEGLLSGAALASMGADMLAANNFVAVYDAAQAFTMRITPVAPVTGGAVTWYLFGWLLP